MAVIAYGYVDCVKCLSSVSVELGQPNPTKPMCSRCLQKAMAEPGFFDFIGATRTDMGEAK